MKSDLIQRIEAYLRIWHTDGNEGQTLLREALAALKEIDENRMKIYEAKVAPQWPTTSVDTPQSH